MILNHQQIDAMNAIKLGEKVTLFRSFRAYRKLDGTLSYSVRHKRRTISGIRKIQLAFAMYKVMRDNPHDTKNDLYDKYYQIKEGNYHETTS